MSKSEKITKGPFWSQNWFEAMWRFTCNNFVNFDTGAVDFEALGREEYEFRKALFFRNFKNSKRARTVFDEAKAEYDKKVENGMKGGRPKKNPQDAPNGNAGVDSKSATSCDQLTADGDTREGSQAKPDGSAITRNETRSPDALDSSANLYGAAHHREAGDVSATDSKNMRRVPQNEAPAHGFSGGRTAQGTMSRSPEAAAQSGKDLALDMPGPDKGEQSAKTRDSRGSGRNQPPSLGPEDGNLYDQETKVSTDDKPTGGHLLRSSSRSPVGDRRVTGDVLNLAYSGEFGNVRLSQEQYAQLGIRFGNLAKLNRAIDSLSCQIENGEKNPKNNYAELVKWASYREDMEEQKEEEASKPKLSKMEQSWINTFKAIERM